MQFDVFLQSNKSLNPFFTLDRVDGKWSFFSLLLTLNLSNLYKIDHIYDFRQNSFIVLPKEFDKFLKRHFLFDILKEEPFDSEFMVDFDVRIVQNLDAQLAQEEVIARQFAVANFDGEEILDEAGYVDLECFGDGIGSCVVVEEMEEVLQGEIGEKRTRCFACDYDRILEEGVDLLLESFALLRLLLLFSFLLSSLLSAAGDPQSFLLDFDEIFGEVGLGFTAGQVSTFLLQFDIFLPAFEFLPATFSRGNSFGFLILIQLSLLTNFLQFQRFHLFLLCLIPLDLLLEAGLLLLLLLPLFPSFLLLYHLLSLHHQILVLQIHLHQPERGSNEGVHFYRTVDFRLEIVHQLRSEI